VADEKNILLIAYYFPPLGLGGVGRPYALFRHLPEHGYRVTVLTVKDIVYPQYDHTRLEVGDEEYIVRSGSYDPSRLMSLAGMRKKDLTAGVKTKASLFYYPDSKRGWVGPAYRAARRLLNRRRFDAVITTSPPPSAHQIGLKIKRACGLPWVADFRDFWFSLPIEMIYRTEMQKRYSLRLKDKIIGAADEVVGVNSSIVKYLGRGEVITNGADLDTANFWRVPATSEKEVFTIGVLGTVNRLCPIEPLFKAIAAIIKDNSSLKNKMNIVHVGSYDTAIMSSLIEKYRLSGKVSIRGYLPKKEAIEALAVSDVLYFSVAAFNRYHILPGRIFDYLMSGKPIIGYVPDGSDAEKLLKEYDNGIIVTDDDTDSIASYISGKAGNGHHDNKAVDDTDYEKHSTQYMAGRYAELLNRIVK